MESQSLIDIKNNALALNDDYAKAIALSNDDCGAIVDDTKWHSGTLVVHKTKCWPWIGVVQVHSSLRIRCAACGLPSERSFSFPRNGGGGDDEEEVDGVDNDDEAIMESVYAQNDDFYKEHISIIDDNNANYRVERMWKRIWCID